MSTVIYPSKLHGAVKAPPSKSHIQRLCLCAALSDAPSRILCGTLCEDAQVMRDALIALGAQIVSFDGGLSVEPIRSGAADVPLLSCGESGAALRFLLPVVCALGGGAEIRLGERLRQRPLAALTEELTRCGARMEYTAGNTLSVRGALQKNECFIPADISSQYASGLLFACAALGGGAVNITTEISSAPYIDMTVEALRSCGVAMTREGNRICVSGRPRMSGTVSCEGDWSGAAFWLCAGAVGTQPVTVTGLDPSSVQGDRNITGILRRFGAQVSVTGDAVTVRPQKLTGITIDADNVPDLIPALSVVCACADGVSRIYNAGRLRTKESDRVGAVCQMIGSLGGDASFDGEDIVIRGGCLSGGSVRSYGDHRIAMAAAIASNVCRMPVTLDDFAVYKKSYPDFARDFISLGGRYESV